MRPHKNAKNGSGSPYVRIKKSILVQIENEAKASKPMHVFDKVYEDCGGVVGAESCRSVLRNKNQVSNVKRSIKKEPGDADPLFAVMEECKKQQSHADPFIRAVKAAPEAMCVFARDHQLNDMANLPSSAAYPSSDKHPVLLGPMLVHQKKTFESCYFLASTVVGLCPQLNFLTAFGPQSPSVNMSLTTAPEAWGAAESPRLVQDN